MKKHKKRIEEYADWFEDLRQSDQTTFHKIIPAGPCVTFDELEIVATKLLDWGKETIPEHKLSLSGIRKKLQHNSLTGIGEMKIRDGLMNEHVVHDFMMNKVSTRNESDYPLKVCGSLLHYYNQFHAINLRGNQLLTSICKEITDRIGDPYLHKSVIALIAYFFARCDIFDQYPGEEEDREPIKSKRRRKS